MKSATGLLFLMLALNNAALAATAGTDAAEATPEPAVKQASGETDSTTTAQNQPEKKTQKKPKQKSKPEQDIFRPSEEISEDFAVPFPVDI